MLSLHDKKTIEPRKFFSNETKDFTPWLVQYDKIRELSDVIKLDIEVIGKEVNAKNRKRVDVLGRTKVSRENVVIENQLTVSDNDHFSRLLQYGVSFNAKYHIWIAPEFKEEHQDTIRDLNEKCAGRSYYYLVQFIPQLLKTGECVYEFRLVVGPEKVEVGLKENNVISTASSKPSLSESFRKVQVAKSSNLYLPVKDTFDKNLIHFANIRLSDIIELSDSKLWKEWEPKPDFNYNGYMHDFIVRHQINHLDNGKILTLREVQYIFRFDDFFELRKHVNYRVLKPHILDGKLKATKGNDRKWLVKREDLIEYIYENYIAFVPKTSKLVVKYTDTSQCDMPPS